MSIVRRWFLFVLLLAIVAGCIRLRLDVQILDLLPPRLKAVEGLKLYEENFSNNRELIVSLRAADAPTADAAAESLAAAFRAQSNLVESVRWRPVWLEDPALSAELLAYIWYNQAPRIFARWRTGWLRPTWPPSFNPPRRPWPRRSHRPTWREWLTIPTG